MLVSLFDPEGGLFLKPSHMIAGAAPSCLILDIASSSRTKPPTFPRL
jgi:hypothetical protein